jgi:hypothetical protein
VDGVNILELFRVVKEKNMSDVVEEIVVRDLEDEDLENESLTILTPEQEEDIMATLKIEHDAADSEMQNRNQKLIKWRDNMEAVAADAPKNHPFKNASNVTVPVTQTITQTIAAKIKGTIDARNPLWDVMCLRQDEVDEKQVKVIGKYLNILAKSPNDLDMMSVVSDLVDETVLPGGCFAKVGYDIQSWKVKDNESGEGKEVISHDGPLITVIPLENVKYRRGVNKISRLPWISVDFPITEVELRERASKGIYDPKKVEEVLKAKRTSPNETEEQRQRAEQFDTGETTPLYDVSEVWVYYDVDGDGIPVDLFLTVSFEANVILKQQYNSLGTRFLVNSMYIRRPNGLVGRGTGQITESSQDEVTSVHNMRNDNMKIANMRIIVTKRATGFGAKREIFPGANWEFDNPREDVQSFQLGEVYPSSLQAENQGLQYGMRAAGLSETQMGFADSTLKSRDTASGQAMRMQTGDSILGNVMEGIKGAISQIGLLVWMQCVANKERVIAREKSAKRMNEEDLAILEQALNMDVSEVPMRLGFIVRTTETDRTYEQQRMNLMTLTQVFAQYAKETAPLAMELFSPQGLQMKQQYPELWSFHARLLVGASKLVEDMFKFYGIYDTNNYVPDSEKLDKVLDMMSAMAGAFQNVPQAPGAGAPTQPQIPPVQNGAEGGQGFGLAGY